MTSLLDCQRDKTDHNTALCNVEFTMVAYGWLRMNADAPCQKIPLRCFVSLAFEEFASFFPKWNKDDFFGGAGCCVG